MIVFDERYVPLLHQANLLAIVEIVRRGMPVFNATTIMVMVDRWRPETHSFHLLCGKMMVTLEDVAMILGLPIRGCPVTGRVDSAVWHKRAAVFIGQHRRPDDLELLMSLDMSCVLQGNKQGCDFNKLVYGPRSHLPDDLELLISLDSDDLSCHYALHPLCQCGV
jgi:hypothetical protein